MKLIFFKKMIIGMLVGAVTTAVLLVVFSAVLYKQDDPSKLMNVFSTVSLLAGAFVCGKVSTLGNDNKGFGGLVSGVCFAGVVLVLTAVLSALNAQTAIKFALTALSAVAGAITGRKSKADTSSKRRKNVIRRYSKS